MQFVTPEIAFKVISHYYEGKSTASNDVPYMNHIIEGLRVLRYLNANDSTLVVYILHPIFQGEEEPKKVIQNIWIDIESDLLNLETDLFVLCAEYAMKANAYLSKHHTIGARMELADMSESVKQSLIADKAQNRKDFLKYHKGTHKNSDLLDDYFKCWLEALVPDEFIQAKLNVICDTKPHIVVFTGAGVSAESGIKTFRDDDGTWETENIEDVATPQGWKKDRERVLNFYNARIKQLSTVKPNRAHELIAELQKQFDVTVITQNVDDLHERAGSQKVMHLHGELLKKSSCMNKEKHITDITAEDQILIGDTCPDGSQWRPYIVWFGEDVPLMQFATSVARDADILIVVGTSLNVYPAANIANVAKFDAAKWLIDPNPAEVNADFKVLKTTATSGMEQLFSILLKGR